MLVFKDISHDTEETYTLGSGEQCVFFMLNRTGNITFTLTGRGAVAHIVALSVLRSDMRIESSCTQLHRSPETTSSFIGRSVLFDQSHLDWRGLVRIEEYASQSDGRQDMRSLLISPDATARTIPSLEIINNDVRCGHASTTSALPKESLYFLESRGLSRAQATHLLIEGFLQDALNMLPIETAQKNMLLAKAFL